MSKISDFNYVRKAQARTSLVGHLGTVVVSVVLVTIIDFVLSGISTKLFSGTGILSVLGAEAVDFLVALFIGAMMYGLYFQQLSLIYGQRTSIADLFGAFRPGAGDRVIKVQAIMSAANLLCFLPATVYAALFADSAADIRVPVILLYLAGLLVRIYLDLSFSQSYFLLADFEDMKALDVVKTSLRMMNGNRLKLFLLKLSFLPLLLIGLISFGIADFWVISYELGADASFYRFLTSGGTTAGTDNT